MRTLTYYVAATLDGFIAGPDGGDPSGEDFMAVTPDLVEFIATHYPETLPGPAREAMGLTEPGRVFDTVIEGRRSYEIGLAAGIDDSYPHLRHLVVSTTLGSAPAAAVEVVSGDPLARVRELKAEDGLGIWLVGGGRLAQRVPDHRGGCHSPLAQHRGQGKAAPVAKGVELQHQHILGRRGGLLVEGGQRAGREDRHDRAGHRPGL